MAETQSPLHSPLLQLPDELLVETVRYLDCNTLCSCARTCQRLQRVCEDEIYSIVRLRSTDRLQDICNAFAQRPRRLQAVRKLAILYKYHEGIAGTLEDRQVLNEGIKDMRNLREWYIESPFDNFKWGDAGGAEWVERDMEMFRQALEAASLPKTPRALETIGLGNLQKLTIHSHGTTTDFWHLGAYHCLFSHPSLRYLHISCVAFPDDIPQLEPFADTTPLTTLIFDECELTPGSLERILKTPKWLKHLALGENCHNIRRGRGPDPRLTPRCYRAVKALQAVAHSLESLTHLDPSFYLTLGENAPRIDLKGDGMRNFDRLKFLECDQLSFLHRAIVRNPALAPPNLETLRLQHHRGCSEDYFDDPGLPKWETYANLPSLKTLEFVQPILAPVSTPYTIARYICLPECLRARHEFAYTLWKRGINVVLYAELLRKSGLIPPYLDGEPLPELLPIYDAKVIGFNRVPPPLEDESSELEEEGEEPVVPEDWRDELSTQEEDEPTAPSEKGETRTTNAPQESDYLSDSDIKVIRSDVFVRLRNCQNRVPGYRSLTIPRRFTDEPHAEEPHPAEETSEISSESEADTFDAFDIDDQGMDDWDDGGDEEFEIDFEQDHDSDWEEEDLNDDVGAMLVHLADGPFYTHLVNLLNDGPFPQPATNEENEEESGGEGEGTQAEEGDDGEAGGTGGTIPFIPLGEDAQEG